jgi:hypothetical protein
MNEHAITETQGVAESSEIILGGSGSILLTKTNSAREVTAFV